MIRRTNIQKTEQTTSPLIGPYKGTSRVNTDLFLILSVTIQVLKHKFLQASRVPVGLWNCSVDFNLKKGMCSCSFLFVCPLARYLVFHNFRPFLACYVFFV